MGRRHATTRRKRARGFTMIEVLAALAITAILVAGVTTMIGSSLEDTRGQQAALYQQQIGAAAKQLIQANAQQLAAVATPTAPAVVQFNAGPYPLTNYLPTGMQPTNAYGQTPCLLVYTDASGALVGLLVTEGGSTIADPELGYIAANSGQGGGSIPVTNNAGGSAIGAFGAWKIAAPNPAGASCSGTKTGFGHLASEVYYNGNVQNSDYLYRVAVPGNPQANTMQVPIVLAPQSDYVGCTALGAVAADTAGNVVNCTATAGGNTWVPQPAYRWRGLFADEQHMPDPKLTPIVTNDIFVSQATNRGYRFDGSVWQPLAVDQNGDLQLGNAHTIGDPCTPPTNGTSLVGTDTNGVVVSCQKNAGGAYQWLGESQITAGQPQVGCAMLMVTPGAGDYSTCENASTGNYTASPYTYNSTNGTYSYTRQISVTLDKPGGVTVAAWAHMNDGQCPIPPAGSGSKAQMSQSVDLLDDSGTVVAHTESQSPTLTEDSGGINNSLVQAVPKSGTYRINVTTNWATYANLSTPWTSSYCGQSQGAVIPNTPLAAGWSVNTFY